MYNEPMNGLSIILCAYNDSLYIRDCLNNLKEIMDAADFPIEVIVKNQTSENNSAPIIEKEFPWVKLIDGANVGLSKAYNIGLSHASYKYILFLGTDAFPEKDVLPGMKDYFDSHKDVGAATCKLILEDGSLDMDAHRAFPTPWNSFTKVTGLNKLFPKSTFFNGYYLPGKNMEEPHEIDLCISHFMFTRKDILDDLNGFDENFFLYGEDVDICYRIKQAGWKIMYLPQWSAKHLKGASLGIRKTTREQYKKPLKHRLKMQMLSAQAMELFLRKHYNGKYPRPLVYSMIFSTRVLGRFRVLMETLR